MNTQKFLVSGIVGGIVSFFAGYLIYGLLLMDFFAKNGGSGSAAASKPMGEFIWWALIAGSIAQGLMLSYIFNKWANITSFGAGMSGGAVVCLLMAAGFDLTMFATSNLTTTTGMVVDILCGGVLGAIVGGTVGLMNGLGKKAA